MTGQTAYLRTSPPHIHCGDSIGKRNWFRLAALLPVPAAALWLGHFEFLRTLFLGIAGVAGLEWLSAGFFRRKDALSNGDAILTGLLFALLLPKRCPAGLIVLGALMATLIISGCFGGLGSRLFNAAAFGRGFLDIIFPGAMPEAMVFRMAGDPWMSGAVALSAVLLLIQRQNYFETWIYYAGIFLAGAVLLGCDGGILAAASAGIFSAFFLLSDPSTLPLTRRGTNLFAMGAAFLAVLFGLRVPMAAAMACAVLIMNCLAPWLDVWFRPEAPEAAA